MIVLPERRKTGEQIRAEERKEIRANIALLKLQKRAQEARDDLLAFTQFTMLDPENPNDADLSAYEAARFHVEIAKAIEAVERGEVVQLIFCMPPRHGKTELATKRFAAWYAGRHPNHDIAVASYSDTMAEDFGADTRAILATKRFKLAFPNFGLRRGGTSKSNIQTTGGGRIVFVGRGGALTGRGANLLLIDDLFKDYEEARSRAVRDAAWNWFTKVAMTRRMGNKLVVITMTRWHSDDVIGRLTDPENPHCNREEAGKWKIIRLPALAEEDDPLNREAGAPLWPERYDLDFLEGQRRLDPLGFAALYQQRPSVADGTLFRRESIRRYDPDKLPDDLLYYAASDHAVGLKQRNDPSCFLKGGVAPNGDLYLTECDWRRMASDAAVEAMLAMAGGASRPLFWWAERGHISKSIGPFLYRRMEETGTYLNLVEVTPVGDKAQRAQSAAARVAVGKVLFPRGVAWADEAVEEMLAFPNGLHDDFVDALALLCLGMGSQRGAGVVKDKRSEEPKFGTLAWVKHREKMREQRDSLRYGGGF